MLRDRLAPGGVLAIATATRSARFASHYFEVLLASTVGCWPLPDRDALESDLCTAGFTSLDRERLVPGDAFFGWLAR